MSYSQIAQMELMNAINSIKSEADLKEFKDLLARYFASKAQKEIDALWNDGVINNDTLLMAKFPACLSKNKGQKQRRGDMKTPECTPAKPFYIDAIKDASAWYHDFKDGRGSIKAYGAWFLRLVTPGHKGIGIHGSTNNESSVPGRASEGCIRLNDADIITLHDYYARVNMKVIIKDEKVDDFPFEIKAMHKAMREHNIERKRHFDPAKILNN